MNASASQRVCRHIRSNVVGYIAVFLALSGTAFALPGKNTVDSRDIINKEVKAADISGGAVKRGKMPNGAVNSAKVLDGSLAGTDLALNTVSGDQVLESSLGPVPQAESLQGVTIRPVSLNVATFNPGPHTVFDLHGMTIRATCETIDVNQSDIEIELEPQDTAFIGILSGGSDIGGERINAGVTRELTEEEETGTTVLTFETSAAGNPRTSISFFGSDSTVQGPSNTCRMRGTAVSALVTP